MDLKTKKHSNSVAPDMKKILPRAYSELKSCNFIHMERWLSRAATSGFFTPALSLAFGAALTMKGNLIRAESIFQDGRRKAQLDGDTSFQAAFSINLGQLYYDLGKPAIAKIEFETACALLRESENYGLLMTGLRQRALLSLFQGDSDSCQTQIFSAIEFAKKREQDQEETDLLYVLGVLLTAKGELQFAQNHLAQGIEIGRQKGSGQLSRVLFQMGLVQLLRGNVEAARKAVNQCLEVAKKEGNLLVKSRGLGLGFTIQVSIGNEKPGVELFDQAIDIEQRSGYRFGVLRHQLILSKLCLQHQDFQGALKLVRMAGSLASKMGHQVATIETRALTAMLESETGDDRVFPILEDCVISSKNVRVSLLEIQMHQLLGAAYLNSGRWSDATQCFQVAAGLSSRAGTRFEEAKALSHLSHVQELQGEIGKASENSAAAQAIFQGLGVAVNPEFVS